MPSLPVIVSMLAAALTSFSRVFDATRPGWGKLPAWFQTLAPTLLMASGAIVAGLAHVATGTDLTVVIVGGLMLVLPGLPSNRSAAPMQSSKPVTGTPSAGDVKVAAAMASGVVAPTPPKDPKPPSFPPLAAAGLFALCLVLCSSCSIFGSGGSFWPKVERCAPSPASLVSQVADALLDGDGYEAALKQMALQDGAAAIECAVAAAVDSFGNKVGASPAEGAARARGKAFLLKHPVPR